MSHSVRLEKSSYSKTICDEPACEFYGEGAVQGVCHTTEGEVCSFARLDEEERSINESIDAMRSENTPEEYVACLEANYACAQLNWTITLDECVRLRRDNARLRKQLSKSEK